MANYTINESTPSLANYTMSDSDSMPQGNVPLPYKKRVSIQKEIISLKRQPKPEHTYQPEFEQTSSSAGHTLKRFAITAGSLGAIGAGAFYLLDGNEATGSDPLQPLAPTEMVSTMYTGGVAGHQEELASNTQVMNGLKLDLGHSFSTQLDRAILQNIDKGLEEGLSVHQSIVGTANYMLARVDGSLHDTTSDMPRGVVLLQDVVQNPVRITIDEVKPVSDSIKMRCLILSKYLQNYSNDEAKTVLDTFGPLLLRPNMAHKAAQSVRQNPKEAKALAERIVKTADDNMKPDTSVIITLCESIPNDANALLALGTFNHIVSQINTKVAVNEQSREVQNTQQPAKQQGKLDLEHMSVPVVTENTEKKETAGSEPTENTSKSAQNKAVQATSAVAAKRAASR